MSDILTRPTLVYAETHIFTGATDASEEGRGIFCPLQPLHKPAAHRERAIHKKLRLERYLQG